ncbi:MAG: hypothetical protein QXO01_05495 [Nitrososphaerota archaeon]
MGIVHFAGLGRSPGAVTSGLCYLKANEDKLRDEFKGKIVESVVIFTSPEIAEGREMAYDVVDNEYMRRAMRKSWKKNMRNSLKIVKMFLDEEFGEQKHFYIKVNVNDFSECFKVIAKALLKFHSPHEVGKHIWANITGGTNVLNLALTQVAYLSGFIPVLYYTFVADPSKDGKYLRPFSQKEDEFDFRRIWVPKTKFDERSIYIYEELKNYDRIKDCELLSRLKNKYPELFGGMEVSTFRRDFLNVMPGIGYEENCNYLTPNGKDILRVLSSQLVKALIRLEEYPKAEIERLFSDLELQEL